MNILPQKVVEPEFQPGSLSPEFWLLNTAPYCVLSIGKMSSILIMLSLRHLQDMQLKRCCGLGFRKELQATDMDLGHIFLYLVNER